MIPKIKEKEESIALRKRGFSVKDIAHMLGVAKGSVSTWVKDVVLTKKQKEKLKKKCHSPEVIEKRRQSRLNNEAKKRNVAIDEAADTIEHINRQLLRFIGISLYWAEGAKAKRGLVRMTNSDPDLIKISMRFFREICKVSESKFRGHIHIHSPEVVKKAEKYWSEITGIPLSQFFKTYAIKSKSSKNKRFTLPYGTLEVCIADVRLHHRIMGWIKGFKKQT